jgi:Microtubule-binding stalk of dynein motor
MKQKAKADESLLEALPAVEAAARALDNLDRNDLTELKAFSNPHPAVKSICMMLVCLRPTGDVRATVYSTVMMCYPMLSCVLTLINTLPRCPYSILSIHINYLYFKNTYAHFFTYNSPLSPNPSPIHLYYH